MRVYGLTMSMIRILVKYQDDVRSRLGTDDCPKRTDAEVRDHMVVNVLTLFKAYHEWALQMYNNILWIS